MSASPLSHPSQRLVTRWDLAGLVLLPGLVFAQGMLLHWQPVDDAYISFRYAHNWSRGLGLVFNAGERVEGYTNFLWTALLALAGRAGLDIVRVGTWAGVVLAGLAVDLTWLLGRRVAAERGWPREMAWAPALLLALYPGWAYWAFAGLEGPLLTCLVLGFLLTTVEPGSVRLVLWGGLLGALAAMTRWEVVLLWPVGVLAQRRWSRGALLAVVMTALFGAYYLWRLRYYGEWMPNTFLAKASGTLLPRLLRGSLYAAEFAVGWLLPLTVIPWLFLAERRGRWTLVLAAVLFVYCGYVVWTGGDFFPWLRFLLPVLPIAAVLIADAIQAVSARFAEKTRGALSVVLLAGVASILCGIAVLSDLPDARAHRALVRNWEEVGIWARGAFRPEERLVLAPIGAVGYFSGLPVVDFLGLTDREVARHGQTDPSEGPGHQRSNIESILARRPEVVLGQAILLPDPPTEAQARAGQTRKALIRMMRSEEFARQYQFTVGTVGERFLPYWVLRAP